MENNMKKVKKETDVFPVRGVFQVATEGDCEGRSIRNLGIYEGYIDDIAFALADECYYALYFERVIPEQIGTIAVPARKSVVIEDDDIMWSTKREQTEYLANLLKDRDVEVSEGNTFRSCKITSHKETLEEKKQKILQKLSKEEREILGLE